MGVVFFYLREVAREQGTIPVLEDQWPVAFRRMGYARARVGRTDCDSLKRLPRSWESVYKYANPWSRCSRGEGGK